MPIIPSLPERALLRLGVVPAPLVDFLQHAAFRLLLAGHRLGVFAALEEGPLTLRELSERLDARPEGLQPFLDLLRRLGYVSVRGGRYANTATTRRWLSADSPQSLVPAIPFLDDFVRRWDHLEETIKEGRPPFTAYEFYDRRPECWPSFHDGMRAIALFTIDEVARAAIARGAATPARRRRLTRSLHHRAVPALLPADRRHLRLARWRRCGRARDRARRPRRPRHHHDRRFPHGRPRRGL